MKFGKRRQEPAAPDAQPAAAHSAPPPVGSPDSWTVPTAEQQASAPPVHAYEDPVGYEPPASVYEEPAPVYEQPAPVYEEPVPVYEQPAPVYEEPAPVYEEPAPVYDAPAPAYEEPAPVAYEEPAVEGEAVELPIEPVPAQTYEAPVPLSMRQPTPAAMPFPIAEEPLAVVDSAPHAPQVSSLGDAGAAYASGHAAAPGPSWQEPVLAMANERPELVVGAAFAGGVLAAMILRRLGS